MIANHPQKRRQIQIRRGMEFLLGHRFHGRVCAQTRAAGSRCKQSRHSRGGSADDRQGMKRCASSIGDYNKLGSRHK